MHDARFREVLDAVLAAWDRSNAALLGLLRALPEGGLGARATPGSPTVGQMFAHMHHERMVSVLENAPEHAGELPEHEWDPEANADRIARMLHDSARRVRDTVESRTASNRPLDRDFAHPVHLAQFLIFHEGYHHGQIKLALKASARSISDDVVGPTVWGMWRARTPEEV
jgi:uncharacterized damage-inducible protein DinB